MELENYINYAMKILLKNPILEVLQEIKITKPLKQRVIAQSISTKNTRHRVANKILDIITHFNIAKKVTFYEKKSKKCIHTHRTYDSHSHFRASSSDGYACTHW